MTVKDNIDIDIISGKLVFGNAALGHQQAVFIGCICVARREYNVSMCMVEGYPSKTQPFGPFGTGAGRDRIHANIISNVPQ